jgi:hypothetical protein
MHHYRMKLLQLMMVTSSVGAAPSEKPFDESAVVPQHEVVLPLEAQ